MRNRVGSYVVGDDFFGREAELERLVGLLSSGEHVSLVAQRRIGKTSLLHAARALLTDRIVLYVDLQDCNDPADALVAVAMAAREHASMWERMRQTFVHVLGGVEEAGAAELVQLKLRASIVGDWRAQGDRMLADLSRGPNALVLMIDELPILLVRMMRSGGQGPERAEQFLAWLRKAAIAHASSMSVVVTGSIGLGPVASRLGASGALNIYRPFLLEPWSPETAIRALQALAAGQHRTLDRDAAETVVELLGSCIPYHVQLFFSFLDEDVRKRGAGAVTRPEDVRRVYHQRMLSSHGHAELAHMEQRLGLLVDPELLPLTLDLLTEAAVTGSLSPAVAARLAAGAVEPDRVRAALQSVFEVLEHDGYLRRDPDGERRFVSRLLRDWWRRRFGEFHVSADRRELK